MERGSKKHYLVQLYMRIYTVHFNRLIRDQFVVQYKHLLGGFLCEPPGCYIHVKLSIVYPATKPRKIKQLFHRKAGRIAAGKVLIWGQIGFFLIPPNGCTNNSAEVKSPSENIRKQQRKKFYFVNESLKTISEILHMWINIESFFYYITCVKEAISALFAIWHWL